MRALLLAALLAPVGASAQDGFDAHGFVMAPSDGDPADLLSVWRAERQVPGLVGVQGLVEWARAPLVIVDPYEGGNQRTRLLDDLLVVNVGAHVGLHERVGVALTLPVVVHSVGVEGMEGFALADARLHVPVGIVLPDDAGAGFGLSAVPFLDLPTGARRRFLGDPTVGGGGVLAAGYGAGPVDLAVNAGVQARPKSDVVNLRGGSQFVLGLGGGYRFDDHHAIRAEAVLTPTLLRNDVAWSESPGEIMASGKGRYADGFSWTAGLALPLTRGAGAAALRLFAGVGWTFGRTVDRDSDDDGLDDDVDHCPTQAEDFDCWRDDDGCPDDSAAVRVFVRGPDGAPAADVEIVADGAAVGRTDASGELLVPDRQPGARLSIAATPPDGRYNAPANVTVTVPEEGESRQTIDLRWLPGTVRVVTQTGDGAPIDAQVTVRQAGLSTAPDGEGWLVLPEGTWSIDAVAAGYRPEHRTVLVPAGGMAVEVVQFALEPARVTMVAQEVVLLDQIQFEFGSAEVSPGSEPILEDVAALLASHRELGRVEVQGHTDDVGTPEYNEDLSQRRMEAVVDLLVGLGVDRSRLAPVGYGEGCPLVVGEDEASRATNRRVQFIVLEPPPAGGIPCHPGVPARRSEPQTLEKPQPPSE